MPTPTVYTPKPLVDPGQFTGSVTTVYTVPASTTTKVTGIILVNDTTTAVTCTVYLVPSGGTAGPDNLLLNAIAIPTDGTPLIMEFAEGVYLETAATIQGLASITAQVTYHLSGVELA